MWRMVASGDIRVTFERADADDREGSARVVDEYTFHDSGRRVRNVIDSRFRFLNGRILEHRDSCDARAWGEMALGGIQGLLAGRCRFLRSWKARKKLRDFNRKHPQVDVGPPLIDPRISVTGR